MDCQCPTENCIHSRYDLTTGRPRQPFGPIRRRGRSELTGWKAEQIVVNELELVRGRDADVFLPGYEPLEQPPELQPPAPAVSFTVKLQTVTGLNAREHKMVRAQRVKRERTKTAQAMRKALGVRRWRCASVIRLPALVVLTRIGPSECDTDNLAGALKAVRDAVAGYLGVDDGCDYLAWDYGQERGPWGVRVEIYPRQSGVARDALATAPEGSGRRVSECDGSRAGCGR